MYNHRLQRSIKGAFHIRSISYNNITIPNNLNYFFKTENNMSNFEQTLYTKKIIIATQGCCALNFF